MFKNKLAIIAMAGMLAMCVGLTACGGSNSNASSSSAASSSSSASSSSASSSSSSSSTASNEILYWEGTASDGSTVSYLDNAIKNVAILSIVKSDLSDVKVWYGSSSVDSQGVVTVKDSETQSTITYTITDITPSMMKIDLEGYGEVVLEPVTEADAKQYAEEVAAAATVEGEKLLKSLESAGKKLEKEVTASAKKLSDELDKLDDSAVLFWSGELANGMKVNYMDYADSSEAFLTVTDANLTDVVAWYGKYTVDPDGTTMTLTDTESGKTVTYVVAETTPGTSMKMNIEGYGDATLTSVTKSDFVKLAEELANESTAK